MNKFNAIVGLCLLTPWAYVVSLQAEVIKPLYALPYVVIYGRDSCPFTRNMKKELKRAAIPYHYKIIDRPNVQQSLFARMEASGFTTDAFTLPVVDVNNTLMVHPTPPKVINYYFFDE